MVPVGVVLGVGPGEVFEVRVVASLLRREAARRIVDQHHLQEIEARLIEVRAQRRPVVAQPFREGRLEVGIRGDAGPDVLGWRAQET